MCQVTVDGRMTVLALIHALQHDAFTLIGEMEAGHAIARSKRQISPDVVFALKRALNHAKEANDILLSCFSDECARVGVDESAVPAPVRQVSDAGFDILPPHTSLLGRVEWSDDPEVHFAN